MLDYHQLQRRPWQLYSNLLYNFFSKIFINRRKYIHSLRMIQTVDDNKGLSIFLFCNSLGHFLQHIEYLIYMYL